MNRIKHNKEARRRALCGADPLTSNGKPAQPKLARDPVEYIGSITRVIPAANRLHGKNKLDGRQLLAADNYRDAYEAMRRSLGNTMDFSGIGGVSNATTPAQEKVAIAAQSLKEARNLVGSQSIVIVESIVCDGRGIEECARNLYGVQDGEKIAARDVNYVGRRLREALTELADLWHPQTRRPRVQGYRPAQGETVVGDAGIRNVDIKPFVMR